MPTSITLAYSSNITWVRGGQGKKKEIGASEPILFDGAYQVATSLHYPTQYIYSPLLITSSTNSRACRQEALKLLHEGHFDLAIPAALQSLRFSIDYFGQNSTLCSFIYIYFYLLILVYSINPN
jgi:hypothetical protein